MVSEKQMIKRLFGELLKQPLQRFPGARKRLEAPSEPGVYVIRKKNKILHVGRTVGGKGGLHQRLKNHLYGSSSFTRKYLKGKGVVLRSGYTYQYLVIRDKRLRAFVEAYAIGILCPKHIGLGE